MKNYIYLEKNKKTGVRGISRNTILHICDHSLKKAKEKHELDIVDTNGTFNLIIRNNTSHINFKMNATDLDINKSEFEKDLEHILSSNLSSLCEGVRFKLTISVY